MREGEVSGDFEWLGDLPLAIFPIASRRGDFAEVDLGREVGGEGESVLACVGIDDVDGFDLGKKVLQGVSTEDIGDTGIEAEPRIAVSPASLKRS